MTTINQELFQLAMSEEARPLMDLVKKHCEENIAPIQQEFYDLHKKRKIDGPGILAS